MNMDILKGKWTQIKGDLKKTFGNLTDDDVIRIEGDLTHAAGVIQERYGITREEAEKRWNEFVGKFTGVLDTIRHGVTSPRHPEDRPERRSTRR